MNSPGHSDNHDPPSPATPSTTTPKEEIPPLLIFSDHLLTHHNLYLDRAMEMGSGFDTRRRKAATKEKRRSDDGKAIPSPTAPTSFHAAAISLVKLAQYGNAAQDPEIGQLLRLQVDGHDEVGGVAGGRQHAARPEVP